MSPAAANAEPPLQKHRFALLGTTLAGDRRMAFLREIVSGESRVVGEGDQLGSMTVAVVQVDRVLLRSGGETEELQLRMDSDSQEALRPEELPTSSAPNLTRDPVADDSQLERAPMASSTPVDVGALLEQGTAVPNPD